MYGVPSEDRTYYAVLVICETNLQTITARRGTLRSIYAQNKQYMWGMMVKIIIILINNQLCFLFISLLTLLFCIFIELRKKEQKKEA